MFSSVIEQAFKM